MQNNPPIGVLPPHRRIWRAPTGLRLHSCFELDRDDLVGREIDGEGASIVRNRDLLDRFAVESSLLRADHLCLHPYRRLTRPASDLVVSQAQFNTYLAQTQTQKRARTDTVIDTDTVTDFNAFNADEWVSAHKTKNYALQDTLVDWLDYWHNKAEHTETRQAQVHQPPTTFNQYIKQKGIEFEHRVIEQIQKKLQTDEFVTICANFEQLYQNVGLYEKQTAEEIMRGRPVIYQAVLLNRSGKLAGSYGMPDLLVRSDYLARFIIDAPVSRSCAPKLSGPYHYVVIDIKYHTLNLCVDGKRIRNSGNIPAYKCQLYVYHHALGQIQGVETSQAYILGRKCSYTVNKINLTDNNCFAKLGCIIYDGWDQSYVQKTIDAINWIKHLRQNGKEWTLKPQPTVPELYPNMTTTNHTAWHAFKTSYAADIGEITLLWNCGVKNRIKAHKQGVYSYRDARCNSKVLGVHGIYKSSTLDRIIKINNRKNFAHHTDRISIQLNKRVDNKWIGDTTFRIAVDFETVSNVFDDLKQLPLSCTQTYVFMIGVAYKLIGSPAKYKMLVAPKLDKASNKNIINALWLYVRRKTDKYVGANAPIPPIYHWGHIERTTYNKIGGKPLSWFDMLECFRKNPIVINGCLGFGLKEVATRLYDLGLIQVQWTADMCADGTTAMVMAHEAYKQTGINIEDNTNITRIREYNRTDCLVIHEIIDLLQKKLRINSV